MASAVAFDKLLTLFAFLRAQYDIARSGNEPSAWEWLVAIEYYRVNHRSLSPAGRCGFLLLIGGSTLMVGVSATLLLGAWPVLLFSAAHVAALWLTFRRLADHDQDYERVTIGDWDVLVESRDGARLQRCRFNRAWVQLRCCTDRHHCCLTLRYAGRDVHIGRLMSDEQRLAWASELRRQLPR